MAIFNQRRWKSLPVQLKYTMLLTLVSGGIMLVMIFVMAWFIQRNYNLFMGDELGVSSQVIEIVRHEQRMLEITLLTLFLFSIGTVFASTFYVTGKLIGPLSALKRQLWQYANGNWTHTFTLRKADDFRELEDLVNQIRQNQLKSSEPPSQTRKY